MKTKKKTAVWFIWMFLLLYLTVWITGIQVKAEDAEPAVAAQVGTITVYNDVNHNGHYYYYKDGIPITVYCYHHDRKQPLLWSSIFVTLMANKIGGLQFGIYRNCQISSRVFHTAVAALPLTKANRSDFE